MPSGFDKLEHLNVLKGFVVTVNNEEQSCNMEELISLTQLNELYIESLDNAVCAMKGGSLLSNKHYLKHLSLSCTMRLGLSYGEEELHKIEEVFNEEQGCNMQELISLTQLNELCIERLDNAVGVMKGGSLLSDKNYLKHLSLRCTKQPGKVHGEEEAHKIDEVFKELAPPSGLETLEINDNHMDKFPSWIISSTLGDDLPHLRNLKLNHCSRVQQLPPLGLFPMLETLTIEDLHNLREWSNFSEEREPIIEFPHLKKLHISSCPKLKGLPSCLATSTLNECIIQYCENLERISDLPSLRKLKIVECNYLISVEKIDALEKLTVCLENRPEWLLRLLQHYQNSHNFKLELHCHANLMKKCVRGGEYWSIIENLSRVQVTGYSRSAEYYLNYTKQPFAYDTNLETGHCSISA